VEIPIDVFALDRDGPPRLWWQRALIAFGASAITHPFVWFAFPRFTHDYNLMVIEAETFAVVVEAIYLRFFGLRNALLWSIVANMASAGLGLLSRYFFGWP
jgi:hypothetical protein